MTLYSEQPVGSFASMQGTAQPQRSEAIEGGTGSGCLASNRRGNSDGEGPSGAKAPLLVLPMLCGKSHRSHYRVCLARLQSPICHSKCYCLALVLIGIACARCDANDSTQLSEIAYNATARTREPEVSKQKLLDVESALLNMHRQLLQRRHGSATQTSKMTPVDAMACSVNTVSAEGEAQGWNLKPNVGGYDFNSSLKLEFHDTYAQSIVGMDAWTADGSMQAFLAGNPGVSSQMRGAGVRSEVQQGFVQETVVDQQGGTRQNDILMQADWMTLVEGSPKPRLGDDVALLGAIAVSRAEYRPRLASDRCTCHPDCRAAETQSGTAYHALGKYVSEVGVKGDDLRFVNTSSYSSPTSSSSRMELENGHLWCSFALVTAPGLLPSAPAVGQQGAVYLMPLNCTMARLKNQGLNDNSSIDRPTSDPLGWYSGRPAAANRGKYTCPGVDLSPQDFGSTDAYPSTKAPNMNFTTVSFGASVQALAPSGNRLRFVALVQMQDLSAQKKRQLVVVSVAAFGTQSTAWQCNITVERIRLDSNLEDEDKGLGGRGQMALLAGPSQTLVEQPWMLAFGVPGALTSAPGGESHSTGIVGLISLVPGASEGYELVIVSPTDNPGCIPALLGDYSEWMDDLRFGQAIVSIGDLDMDGMGDIAVGTAMGVLAIVRLRRGTGSDADAQIVSSMQLLLTVQYTGMGKQAKSLATGFDPLASYMTPIAHRHAGDDAGVGVITDAAAVPSSLVERIGGYIVMVVVPSNMSESLHSVAAQPAIARRLRLLGGGPGESFGRSHVFLPANGSKINRGPYHEVGGTGAIVATLPGQQVALINVMPIPSLNMAQCQLSLDTGYDPLAVGEVPSSRPATIGVGRFGRSVRVPSQICGVEPHYADSGVCFIVGRPLQKHFGQSELGDLSIVWSDLNGTCRQDIALAPVKQSELGWVGRSVAVLDVNCTHASIAFSSGRTPPSVRMVSLLLDASQWMRSARGYQVEAPELRSISSREIQPPEGCVFTRTMDHINLESELDVLDSIQRWATVVAVSCHGRKTAAMELGVDIVKTGRFSAISALTPISTESAGPSRLHIWPTTIVTYDVWNGNRSSECSRFGGGVILSDQDAEAGPDAEGFGGVWLRHIPEMRPQLNPSFKWNRLQLTEADMQHQLGGRHFGRQIMSQQQRSSGGSQGVKVLMTAALQNNGNDGESRRSVNTYVFQVTSDGNALGYSSYDQGDTELEALPSTAEIGSESAFIGDYYGSGTDCGVFVSTRGVDRDWFTPAVFLSCEFSDKKGYARSFLEVPSLDGDLIGDPLVDTLSTLSTRFTLLQGSMCGVNVNGIDLSQGMPVLDMAVTRVHGTVLTTRGHRAYEPKIIREVQNRFSMSPRLFTEGSSRTILTLTNVQLQMNRIGVGVEFNGPNSRDAQASESLVTGLDFIERKGSSRWNVRGTLSYGPGEFHNEQMILQVGLGSQVGVGGYETAEISALQSYPLEQSGGEGLQAFGRALGNPFGGTRLRVAQGNIQTSLTCSWQGPPGQPNTTTTVTCVYPPGAGGAMSVLVHQGGALRVNTSTIGLSLGYGAPQVTGIYTACQGVNECDVNVASLHSQCETSYCRLTQIVEKKVRQKQWRPIICGSNFGYYANSTSARLSVDAVARDVSIAGVHCNLTTAEWASDAAESIRGMQSHERLQVAPICEEAIRCTFDFTRLEVNAYSESGVHITRPVVTIGCPDCWPSVAGVNPPADPTQVTSQPLPQSALSLFVSPQDRVQDVSVNVSTSDLKRLLVAFAISDRDHYRVTLVRIDACELLPNGTAVPAIMGEGARNPQYYRVYDQGDSRLLASVSLGYSEAEGKQQQGAVFVVLAGYAAPPEHSQTLDISCNQALNSYPKVSPTSDEEHGFTEFLGTNAGRFIELENPQRGPASVHFAACPMHTMMLPVRLQHTILTPTGQIGRCVQCFDSYHLQCTGSVAADSVAEEGYAVYCPPDRRVRANYSDSDVCDWRDNLPITLPCRPGTCSAGKCKNGWAGPGCSLCDNGYFQSSIGIGQCQSCSRSRGDVIFENFAMFVMPTMHAMIAASIAAWTGAGQLIEKGMLSDAINNLQTLSLILQFEHDPSQGFQAATGPHWLASVASLATTLTLPLPQTIGCPGGFRSLSALNDPYLQYMYPVVYEATCFGSFALVALVVYVCMQSRRHEFKESKMQEQLSTRQIQFTDSVTTTNQDARTPLMAASPVSTDRVATHTDKDRTLHPRKEEQQQLYMCSSVCGCGMFLLKMLLFRAGLALVPWVRLLAMWIAPIVVRGPEFQEHGGMTGVPPAASVAYIAALPISKQASDVHQFHHGYAQVCAGAIVAIYILLQVAAYGVAICERRGRLQWYLCFHGYDPRPPMRQSFNIIACISVSSDDLKVYSLYDEVMVMLAGPQLLVAAMDMADKIVGYAILGAIQWASMQQFESQPNIVTAIKIIAVTYQVLVLVVVASSRCMSAVDMRVSLLFLRFLQVLQLLFFLLQSSSNTTSVFSTLFGWILALSLFIDALFRVSIIVSESLRRCKSDECICWCLQVDETAKQAGISQVPHRQPLPLTPLLASLRYLQAGHDALAADVPGKSAPDTGAALNMHVLIQDTSARLMLAAESQRGRALEGFCACCRCVRSAKSHTVMEFWRDKSRVVEMLLAGNPDAMLICEELARIEAESIAHEHTGCCGIFSQALRALHWCGFSWNDIIPTANDQLSATPPNPKGTYEPQQNLLAPRCGRSVAELKPQHQRMAHESTVAVSMDQAGHQ